MSCQQHVSGDIPQLAAEGQLRDREQEKELTISSLTLCLEHIFLQRSERTDGEEAVVRREESWMFVGGKKPDRLSKECVRIYEFTNSE